MLTLVKSSEASKLGGIAATYRAGATNIFSTCPTSCPLLPLHQPSANQIDQPYLEALIQAVPKKGLAWTYTHFHHSNIPLNTEGTTINVSTDTTEQAIEAFTAGYPSVYAAPFSWFKQVPKYPTPQPIKFVECPANLNTRITCRNCGNGMPLCARKDRSYIIVFPGHGTKKKYLGTPTTAGSCYGAFGPVRHAWNRVNKKTQDRPDPELLIDWVKTLPYRSFLRHHVVGDLGQL